MARRKKHEEHENHERWLVSYADFITLLFAFFVVMYSISSVNEGKYRVLSSSIISAFSHPAKTMEPIQQGTPLRAPIIQHQSLDDPDTPIPRHGVDHQIMPTPREMSNMQKLADELEANLKEMIDKEQVKITKTNKGVEIEVKSNILFLSGSARLEKNAKNSLTTIAQIIKPSNNDINVEGFTDNVPIKTLMFPSNWELSSARASSVVHLFTEVGIEPERLTAIGYGEYRPIATNETEKGRAQNRRIAIMVLNKPDDKRVALPETKKKPEPRNTLGNSISQSIMNAIATQPIEPIIPIGNPIAPVPATKGAPISAPGGVDTSKVPVKSPITTQPKVDSSAPVVLGNTKPKSLSAGEAQGNSSSNSTQPRPLSIPAKGPTLIQLPKPVPLPRDRSETP